MRASGLRARSANFTLGGPGRARTVPQGEGRFLAIISPRRRDAREAEGGALLRRYMGLNPYRGFESLSLRHHPSTAAPEPPSSAGPRPPGPWRAVIDSRSRLM